MTQHPTSAPRNATTRQEDEQHKQVIGTVTLTVFADGTARFDLTGLFESNPALLKQVLDSVH